MYIIIDALRYAERHGAMLVETSAKTAANIAALFMEISKCHTQTVTWLKYFLMSDRISILVIIWHHNNV